MSARVKVRAPKLDKKPRPYPARRAVSGPVVALVRVPAADRVVRAVATVVGVCALVVAVAGWWVIAS